MHTDEEALGYEQSKKGMHWIMISPDERKPDTGYPAGYLVFISSKIDSNIILRMVRVGRDMI
jgi:hypothetical protein